jgi:5'-phosphate synthase pdxT subunit
MVAPEIGVLALQGDVREHLAALEAVGARGVPVRRVGELEAVEALVIPGGESTTIGHLLDVFALRAPLERRLKEGMPTYGSCAGMILLADTILDGRPDQRGLGGIAMTVRRNAFGRQRESFEAELAFEGAPAGVHGVFIRAPWVERLAPEVQVLARIPAGAHGEAPGSAVDRIVAVRQGDLLATAFHPELTGDHYVHRYFVTMVASARAR